MKKFRHNIIYPRRERRRKKYRLQKIKKIQKYSAIYLTLKLILILLLLLSYDYFLKIISSQKKLKQKLLIEVDLRDAGQQIRRGPSQLQYSISKILPYETKNCKFMPVKKIKPTNDTIYKEVDYFLISDPAMEEQTFDKWKFYNRTNSLLLGPAFVPHIWNRFPCNIFWNERRYREVLQSIKAELVHSERVRDHLLTRSGNQDLINKVIIFRACTHKLPKYIKPFKEREVDIMLYEKFADNNHKKQANELYNLLRSANKRVEILKYGHYNQQHEFQLANNTKFVIYFSFYDTGALSLKEIQNYGVISFSLQNDLVISDKTSYFIPELENNDITIAFNNIKIK